MLLEEDRPVVSGVFVRAATVDALVDLLVDSFCKYKDTEIFKQVT